MRDPISGKIILNSDDLFRMLPRYEARPADRMFLGPLLYPVARDFTDATYARLLARPATSDDTIVFTAGGSATGKSSILRSAGRKRGVDFVVDTTFSNVQRALNQVNLALAAGRKVEIYYVHRDFRESAIAMIERALDPASGRIVPIDDMARTHFGAQRSVLEAIVNYWEEPRVLIELRANSAGKLRQLSEEEFARKLHPSVDALAELGQSVLNEFRENQDQQGRSRDPDHDARGESLYFSEAFYEAARSQTKSRGKTARQGHAGGLSKGGQEGRQKRRSAPKTRPRQLNKPGPASYSGEVSGDQRRGAV